MTLLKTNYLDWLPSPEGAVGVGGKVVLVACGLWFVVLIVGNGIVKPIFHHNANPFALGRHVGIKRYPRPQNNPHRPNANSCGPNGIVFKNVACLCSLFMSMSHVEFKK